MDNSNKIRANDIAQMIDHSLLRPELTTADIIEGCKTAHEYKCATVCVKPSDVGTATQELKGSPVKVTTVIGFPHGSNLTETKVFEAEQAIKQGCRELDMVLNIGKLKSGEFDYVETDVKAICELAAKNNVPVKVIFENFYLTDEEKVKACEICAGAGACWVKTSTGFAGGGATVEDLQLMRKNTPDSVQVKAAGGVRTLDAALTVRKIGCTRFGATATVKILEEANQREKQGTLKLPETIEPLGKKY
jgi:deoxyribose-phosphate aldolase